jgi:uncharacterized membrane protein YphA (DoxX/SURF4 family)
MKLTRIWIKQWNQFFFEPESPVTLGLFRFAFGFLLLFNWILIWPDLDVWYGKTGLMPLDMGTRLVGGPHFNFLLWFPESDLTTRAFFVFLLISCTCFALGFFTRLSSILVFLCLVSFQHRNLAIMNGGDTLMRVISFLMIFTHSGRVFSVDQWLRSRSRSSHSVQLEVYSPWAFRLIHIQISILYTVTGYHKLMGSTWRDGSALYYILRMDDFQKLPLPDFLMSITLSRWMSWGTIALELSLGLLIWFPRLRYPLITLGIGFHVAIEALMNIPIFELLMVLCLLSFIPSKDLLRLLRRFTRRTHL